MADFDTVLVPVDDSPESERIIPVAAAVAEAFGARIEFLTVDSFHGDVGTTGLYQRRLIDSLPTPVAGAGTVVQGDGPVVDLILGAYRARPTALLALATRAPGALWQWLGGGSVGDEVVEESLRPVLLAGPRCDAVAAGPAIAAHTTAALDGSPLDEQVLGAAIGWSASLGTPLTLLRAVVTPAQPNAHRDAADDVELRACEARRHGLDVHPRVVDAGDPGRAVLQHVTAVGGTLVVGSHRRSALGRIVHGSNALWLVHRSPVPVLVAGFAVAPARAAGEAAALGNGAPELSPCWSWTAPELMGWSELGPIAV